MAYIGNQPAAVTNVGAAEITDGSISNVEINANAAIDFTKIDSADITLNGQSVTIPVGTTAQRPASPANGMLRYNTTLSIFEGYENGAWRGLGTEGSSQVTTPVLSGSSTAVGGSSTAVTISNYNASHIYTISVTGGTFTRSSGTITWLLPSPSNTTTYYMTVFATENSIRSADATWDISVSSASLTADAGITISDFSSNSSTTGWSV